MIICDEIDANMLYLGSRLNLSLKATTGTIEPNSPHSNETTPTCGYAIPLQPKTEFILLIRFPRMVFTRKIPQSQPANEQIFAELLSTSP